MKKMVCILMTLLMVLSLVACGKRMTSGLASSNEIAIEEEKMNEGDTLEKETSSEDDPKEIVEEVDPIGLLRTTEMLAKYYGGLFLQRGEDLYVINNNFARTPGIEYLPGATNIVISSGEKGVQFYDVDRAEKMFSSYGEVPIPVVGEGDKLIVFSRFDVPEIDFYPAYRIGYSFFKDRVGREMYLKELSTGEYIALDMETYKSIKITNSAGEEVENNDDLVKDEKYTVSWFEGTEYNQFTMTANSCVYRYEEENAHRLEGQLTMNGYAEYDVTSLPSGIYFARAIHTTGGGLIEIP